MINGKLINIIIRTNILKDEKDDLVTDCHSISVRWRNHFCQLLNVHGVNDVSPKYIQHNHECLSHVPVTLRKILKVKNSDHKVLIKFQQN